MSDSTRDLIAGLIRDAVMSARDRGATIYAASEDAAELILKQLPTPTNVSDETELRGRLDALLVKWRHDRGSYPECQFGAQYAAVAVELCERELRAELRA